MQHFASFSVAMIASSIFGEIIVNVSCWILVLGAPRVSPGTWGMMSPWKHCLLVSLQFQKHRRTFYYPPPPPPPSAPAPALSSPPPPPFLRGGWMLNHVIVFDLSSHLRRELNAFRPWYDVILTPLSYLHNSTGRFSFFSGDTFFLYIRTRVLCNCE